VSAIDLQASPSRFPIGTKFHSRGKYPKLCTVTDILRTYDNAGNLVSIRYIATHSFCGQVVADTDVNDMTIARGLVVP